MAKSCCFYIVACVTCFVLSCADIPRCARIPVADWSSGTQCILHPNVYIINSTIGHGKHASIFHVINKKYDKDFAMKRSIGTKNCNVMKQEYKIMIRLQQRMIEHHPNDEKHLFPFGHQFSMIQLDQNTHDTNEDCICFLVMDLIKNIEMMSKFASNYHNKLSDGQLIEIMVNCFDDLNATLSIMHESNIYHNDLHEYNILYNKNKLQCYLIDFGEIFDMKNYNDIYNDSLNKPYLGDGSRYSWYAFYKLRNANIRQQASPIQLNYYGMMDDIYNIAVIVLDIIIATMDNVDSLNSIKEKIQTADKDAGWYQKNETVMQNIWCWRLEMANIMYSMFAKQPSTLDKEVQSKFLQIIQIVFDDNQLCANHTIWIKE